MLVAAGLADGYLNRPHLPSHLRFYLEAFYDLQADRVAQGLIPFAVLDRYAARHGIDHIDDFLRFKTLVRALDVVDFNIMHETAQQKADMAAGASKKRGRTL